MSSRTRNAAAMLVRRMGDRFALQAAGVTALGASATSLASALRNLADAAAEEAVRQVLYPMTRRMAKRTARRLLAPPGSKRSDDEPRFKVKACRRGGRCVVIVTRRPRPSERGRFPGVPVLVASAPTWRVVDRQLRSGFPVRAVQ